jgi:putative ABC transport system permease protein
MLAKVMLASLKTRRTSALLIVAAIGLSVLMIIGIDRVRHQVRANFSSTISGTDLIVSARGGPMNILLYSVFRLSDPTAGISWKTVEHLADHPDVKWWIPIALGDSHRGYPVVATNDSYLAHYRYGRDQRLALQSGAWFARADQAVLGSAVAARLGYQQGEHIVLAHGASGPAIVEHDNHPFTVVGILAPTGTPVDQSVHISLEGMAVIHRGGAYRSGLPPMLGQARDKPDSVNAVMLGLKRRMAVLSLQRELSRYEREPLTAIIPGVQLQRLWRITAAGENALRATSLAVLVSTVLAALEGRRHEIAVLRATGAGRLAVYTVIVGESLCLTVLGCLLGLGVLFLAQWGLAPMALAEWSLRLPEHFLAWRELPAIGAILLAGSLAGLIPAEKAFRNSLADGLTPRN